MNDKIGDAVSRITATIGPELGMHVSAAAARFAEYCESPIETMLATALSLGMNLERWGNQPWGWWELPTGNEARQFMLPSVIPQYRWEDYRIDFAFFFEEGGKPIVFVECDGHAFHERTPEQAEHDRSRDRAALEAGIPVLRFTGREIYRDPFACAAQILRFLSDRHREMRHEAP